MTNGQKDDGCACQDRGEWWNFYHAIQNDALLRTDKSLIFIIFHLFFSGLISKMVAQQMEWEHVAKERLHS